MWRKTAPLLVILSVALNAAFIGVWGVQVARSQRVADKSDSPEAVWCPLHRQLGVTEAQWERIEPLLEAFRRRSQEISGELGRLRAELIQILAGAAPDPEAIDTKQEEIRAWQKQMQELVIAHLLAEKEILTAEQAAEMFAMLHAQSYCSRPGRMLRFDERAMGREGAARRDVQE